MPGITIGSAYGAGGEQIAPLVAKELGWELLDRAISVKVATDLRVSEEEATEGERKKSLSERFFSAFIPMAEMIVGDQPLDDGDAEDFRERAEEIMREALPGGVVILGRAGAAALRGDPDVLKVRLYGTKEERIKCAMKYTGVDEDTAREQLPVVDKARAKYWDHLYGIAIEDPSVYHLQLNTPLFDLDTCVRMIVDAYRDFATRN